MITDRQRYEDRHRRIVQRCEQRLRERLEQEPTITSDALVYEYVREVRRGIARRDNSGIVAVFAVMAAHLALKKVRSNCSQTEDASTEARHPLPESQSSDTTVIAEELSQKVDSVSLGA